MIVCSCLNITTKDIEDLLKKSVDLKVRDVYNEFQKDSKHTPCGCCPRQIHKEIERVNV